MADHKNASTAQLDREPGGVPVSAGVPGATPAPAPTGGQQTRRQASDAPATDRPSQPRPTVEEPVVAARGLGLRTRRGWVFQGVDLDVRRGELVALTGRGGSGRTSLLLALAGRFATNHGTLSRHGRAALGYVPAVSEPEAGLTVAEHVEERFLLLGRYRWRRTARRQRVAEALRDYPGAPDQLVRGVDTYHRHLLGLVLAGLENPALVVVDDVDADLSTAERADLWVRLRALADSGVGVVAACREADPRVPDRIVTLGVDR